MRGSQWRSLVSDDLEHQIANEQIERRRLSRLIEALPVLAGFISPDGHLLHTVSPNNQTFIWDMPEFSYSHNSVTAIIDFCDRAARGERIQLERPYRKNIGRSRKVELGRGLLTFDPMQGSDGHINEIAVSLIDCDEHKIPSAQPLEKSRLAIANNRIESTLSFAQMVVETLWFEEFSATDASGSGATPSRRDRMSQRLDMIASIIDPLSDPDLDVIPLEVLIDSISSSQGGADFDQNLRLLLPDADIPMEHAPLMALVLGELFLNARQHGAWSRPDPDGGLGHICVEADQFDGPDGSYLRIDWTEDGGPSVPVFDNRGFGLTLCERLFPQMTGGSATMANLEDGISWTLELPVRDQSAEPPTRQQSSKLIYSDFSSSDLPPEIDLDPA